MNRPIQTIKNEIAEQEMALFHLPNLPHLPSLEKAVAELAARAHVSPTLYNPQLREAIDRLDAARDQHTNRANIELALARLKDELAEATRQEALFKAQEADRRLSAAISEYRHAALQTARLYRAMLTIARQNHSIHGASTSTIDPDLNIPHLMPVSWQGTLGAAMRTGTLPWEETERKAA